ncbi:hypothetical protein VTN96DRAFT_8685 [Rasamsonia emersonii]
MAGGLIPLNGDGSISMNNKRGLWEQWIAKTLPSVDPDSRVETREKTNPGRSIRDGCDGLPALRTAGTRYGFTGTPRSAAPRRQPELPDSSVCRPQS